MTAIALHSLGQARDILDTWLEEAGGEFTPEIEALLEELDGKLDEKIENVALYAREQLVTADAIEAEIARLSARAAAHRKGAERLKNYLLLWMERIGKPKVQGTRCTVAVQNNPPAVKGDLAADVLECLYAGGSPIARFIPSSWALDRRAALTIHKDGGALPEGLSVEQGKSLRIR